MVTSTEQADRLCEIAQAKGLTLMVDHTFVFSEPVRKMCEIAGKGLIGELLYFTSIRVNLGTFRRDANVVWDLAPHDLSIIQCLSGRSPVAVLATGGLEMGSGVCQTAHLTVYYLPDVMAHITVSWLSPVKVRLMLIGGARQMMVYNDLEADERVKVYDRSVEVTAGAELPTGGASFEGVVEYRVGDMWAPNIGRGEALFAELDHLATCLASGDEPLTSGSRSREIVATLAAADRSLSRHGELQILDASGWSLWSGRVSDRA
jgi:predicted dehydrogenase